MDWKDYAIPAMRIEARFGDRVVPAFCQRPNSIWAMLSEAAARNPDGEALVCGERRMNWRDVVLQSASVAAGLRKIGIGAGDRVALLLGNRIEFVLAVFAAANLGAVTVLLGIRQQKPEIAHVLNDCGAVLLIHEAALSDRLPDAGDIPGLKHRLAVDDGDAGSAFPDLADNAPLQNHADVDEQDTAMILYTSGTTGRPKGAMLAHCNIIHSAMIYQSCMALTAADRSIAAVPLAHVTGVVANIMSMARCAGTLIIVAEFKAAEYLKIAARQRVTQTVMVPAMYNLCLLQADFDCHDLTSWRIGGFGGAPMPIATIEQLATKIPGLKLLNAYGSTETTSPSTIMPPELTAAHIDSVGLPCPGAHIIVVDPGGRELPRGRDRGDLDSRRLGHQGLLEQSEGDCRELYRRILAFRRSRLDRRAKFCACVRSSEGHDQSRRTEDLFGRSRIGARGPSRRGRERRDRQAVPGAGRAGACRDRRPRRRCHRRSAACLVRRAAFRLQGAGDGDIDGRTIAAQRQWQGHEEAVARRVGRHAVSASAEMRCNVDGARAAGFALPPPYR